MQRSALPRQCTITGFSRNEADWWSRFEQLLERSPEMVLLRLPEADDDHMRAVALGAKALLADIDCELLLNGPVSLVRELDLDGVHLTSRALMSLEVRPMSRSRRVGASCHTPAELTHAQRLGLDYVLLSPIQATPTHPDRAPLGWARFQRWVQDVTIPVLALGGVGPEDLECVQALGGYGVAGISEFWPQTNYTQRPARAW